MNIQTSTYMSFQVVLMCHLWFQVSIWSFCWMCERNPVKKLSNPLPIMPHLHVKSVNHWLFLQLRSWQCLHSPITFLSSLTKTHRGVFPYLRRRTNQSYKEWTGPMHHHQSTSIECMHAIFTHKPCYIPSLWKK